MEEWKKYRLDDFIEFNPTLSLKKGTIARKITMDQLIPHSRDIYSWVYEPYSGGSKFQNGDTIMARITPCLENGKHAFVSLLDNGETAYGSTEYIVMRGKPGISDNLFVYYFSHFPAFKNAAIKSMVGSSGRQRAQVDVLKNLEFYLPGLKEQKMIADSLSALDDKIALNNRINHNLEEQAQALYKSWFVEFEPFRDGKFIDSEFGLIPDGWHIGNISEMISDTYNGDWGKEESTGAFTKRVFCIRGADIPSIRVGSSGKMPTRFIQEKHFLSKYLKNDDLVIEISGGSPTQSTGRFCRITSDLIERYDHSLICTNFCKAIRPIEGCSLFLSYLWNDLYEKGTMFSYENGTTGIKNLDLSGLIMGEPVIIPDKRSMQLFSYAVSALNKQILFNGHENEKLGEQRDLMLPKLMSGEMISNNDVC